MLSLSISKGARDVEHTKSHYIHSTPPPHKDAPSSSSLLCRSNESSLRVFLVGVIFCAICSATLPLCVVDRVKVDEGQVNPTTEEVERVAVSINDR